MKNAIIFHGSGSTPKSFWFPYLKKELEALGYEVWVPQLPNAEHPKLSDWLPFALKNGKYGEETVLVGHSAGCPLILSILDNIDVKVSKVLLVAGFVKPLSPGPELMLQEKYDWYKIKCNSNEFYFINSNNDPWGCDDKQGKYMFDRLGGDQIILPGAGHMGSDKFNQPYKEFPMLVELIVGKK
jgi:uncharacterized protein